MQHGIGGQLGGGQGAVAADRVGLHLPRPGRSFDHVPGRDHALQLRRELGGIGVERVMDVHHEICTQFNNEARATKAAFHTWDVPFESSTRMGLI